MNFNQLLNMIARMLTRRAVNWGINKGIGRAARTGGKGRASPAERKQAQQNRAAVKRARQAARLARRIGR